MQYPDLFEDDVINSGKPQDLELGEQTIIDFRKHSEHLRRNIAFAERCIQERIRQLGLTQNFGFDSNRIFGGQTWNTDPGYIGNLDIITVPGDSELSTSTILHEMLHAYSSEWQGREAKEVEKRRHKKGNKVSSGFSIVARGDKLFNALNEGITDLMMYDILQQNWADFQGINEENGDARSKYVERLTNRYGDEIARVMSEGAEKALKRERELEEVRIEDHKKNVSDFKNKAREYYRRYKASGNKELYDFERETNRDFYEFAEGTVGLGDNFIKKGDELNTRFEASLWETTRDHRIKIVSNTTHLPSYKKEVQLVEVFIDMIAYARTKRNNQDFSMNREDIWMELQRYYFKGNLQGLRRLCEEVGVEKGDGRNFFRLLSELKTGSEENENRIGTLITDIVEYIRESFNPEYQAPKEK